LLVEEFVPKWRCGEHLGDAIGGVAIAVRVHHADE
jgi:hypothetical protein